MASQAINKFSEAIEKFSEAMILSKPGSIGEEMMLEKMEKMAEATAKGTGSGIRKSYGSPSWTLWNSPREAPKN